MSRIVILGAGVMGSALAVPAAASRDNHVTLAGSPLDDDIVDAVNRSRHHPTLDVALPDTVHACRAEALDAVTLATADIVIIGVSSPGVLWAIERLEHAGARPAVLALVTKGLIESAGNAPPLTYADALPSALCATPHGLVGIGGPCIARELALGFPTRVTFASRDATNAARLRERLQTDSYRITVSADIVGVEACAALKNFLCIGISAMFSMHRLGDSHAKNPLSALFNQGVRELALLAAWLREGSTGAASGVGAEDPVEATTAAMHDVAFDLAGMGDLHVTVGGGRNSRLGRLLGEGRTLGALLDGPLRGVTVEGVDTGRALSNALRTAVDSGRMKLDELPLTHAILDCIDHDHPFSLDFRDLPG